MSSELQKIVGELNLYNKKGSRTFFPALVDDVWVDDDDVEHASCVQVESDGVNGWHLGFTVPNDLTVSPGDLVLVGNDGFNSVGFIYCNGRVIKNFNDEDYEREHREWKEDWERRKRKMLEDNRADWEARESYLSAPSRSRIEFFRENADEDFDLEGWGYELVIGELTDMLVDSNLEETDEIKASLAYSQCSGNQFGLAKALARAILAGEDITGTVAGLAPLTGKVHY